jgi:hypothetical protein
MNTQNLNLNSSRSSSASVSSNPEQKTSAPAKAAAADTFKSLLTRRLKSLNQGLAEVRARIEEEFRLLDHESAHLLHLALNEAEALAWQTDFPQLLFPSLALEKVHNDTRWRTRQESLRGAPALLAFAA